MWKRNNIASFVLIIVAFASCLRVLEAVPQTKASVPKTQNRLAVGEDAVRSLLLLMEPDKNGKISKQDWMKFMGEEFDRLDKDNKGELDAQELRHSNVQFERHRVGK